uniref:Uncharacterized protein n=1 Tax=Anguilla anguilla TaxID=7936 RepID=A0A0E9RIM3_ANGAN
MSSCLHFMVLFLFYFRMGYFLCVFLLNKHRSCLLQRCICPICLVPDYDVSGRVSVEWTLRRNHGDVTSPGRILESQQSSCQANGSRFLTLEDVDVCCHLVFM